MTDMISDQRHDTAPSPAGRLSPPSRPRWWRRVRWGWAMAAAALIVVAGVAGFAVNSSMAARHQVLVLARPAPVGHELTSADLRAVEASGLEEVATFASAGEVEGRTLAVPVPAGAVLTEQMIGDAAFPASGQAITAAMVKPGAFPPGLAAGARVAVLTTAGEAPLSPGETAATGAGAPVTAQVLSVRPAGSADSTSGEMVVELLLAQVDLQQVSDASSAGRVALAALPRA